MAGEAEIGSVAQIVEWAIENQCIRALCVRGSNEQRLIAIPDRASGPHYRENVAAVLRIHYRSAVTDYGIGFHHVAQADNVKDSRRAVEAQKRAESALIKCGVELEVRRRNASVIGQAININRPAGEVQAFQLQAPGDLSGIGCRDGTAGVRELHASEAIEDTRAILTISAKNEIVEARLEDQRPAEAASVDIDIIENQAGSSAAIRSAVSQDGGLLDACGTQQYARKVHAAYAVDLGNQEHGIAAAQDLRSVDVGKTGGLMRLAFDVDRGAQDPRLIDEDKIVVGMNLDAVGESAGQAVGHIQSGVEVDVTHGVGDVHFAAARVVRGLNRGFQVDGIVVHHDGV